MPAPEFPQATKEAIESYFSLLRSPPEDQLQRNSALARTLDGLVAAYHVTPDLSPEVIEVDPPESRYHDFYALASEAFPDLGYYPDIEPRTNLDEEPHIGDAIDDLADIARDLSNVLWWLEHHSVGDAVFDFRHGFQTHWGNHLFNLRRYLHTSDIAAW